MTNSRTINVSDGGDYVEGDKVAGDKVMGSKVDKQVSIGGSVSGSNINLGDHVTQTLSPDNRSLEELLSELSELIKAFPDSEHKKEALEEFETIKIQSEQTPEKRDNKMLKRALSYLPDVLKNIAQSTTAITIASLIKDKLSNL